MNTVSRIIDKIREFEVTHSQRPHLLLLGLKEKNELYVELFPKKLPSHFCGIRIIYTFKESEINTLLHELKREE